MDRNENKAQKWGSILAEVQEINPCLRNVIVSHLRDGGQKLTELADALEEQNTQIQVENYLLEKIPQIFLHCALALRSVNEEEFDERLEAIMGVTRNLIGQLNIEELVEQNEKLQSEEKGQFDFSVNETLSIQRIVRSTFLNPDHKKFDNPFSESDASLAFDKEDLDAENFLLRVETELPEALH